MTVPTACVIGWPVKHSRSPVIHRFWLRQYGIDGDYVIQPVEPERIEAFLAGFAEAGFVGGNVTVPHKEAAFAAVDEVEAAAPRHRRGQHDLARRRTTASAPSPTASVSSPISTKARPAGTAGRGRRWCSAPAARRGRSSGRCWRAASRRSTSSTAPPAGPRRLPPISGRPCGRQHGTRCPACSRRAVSSSTRRRSAWRGSRRSTSTLRRSATDCLVTDLVYVPLETRLLAAARARGLRTVDGLGMLLHQAVPGFERWFGRMPEVTPALRAAVLRDMGLA